jgi:hypothetical protein
MHKYIDLIEYAAIDRFMNIVRRTRIGAYWACGACEHCEENK